MKEWIRILLPGFLGLATAVLAAFLSARWAVQRAYREKWWERKEKVYAELVESLHDMIRYCELMADPETHLGENDPPKKKEFSEKYTEAYWKIKKLTDIGAFVISEDATEVLERLRKRPKLDWDENPPWEIYEADLKHYREALAEIRELARKELGV
jgi:hypothetical protein